MILFQRVYVIHVTKWRQIRALSNRTQRASLKMSSTIMVKLSSVMPANCLCHAGILLPTRRWAPFGRLSARKTFVGFSEPRGHRDCSINSLHHCSAFLHLNSLSRCAIVTTYTCPSSTSSGQPFVGARCPGFPDFGSFCVSSKSLMGGSKSWSPLATHTGTDATQRLLI